MPSKNRRSTASKPKSKPSIKLVITHPPQQQETNNSEQVTEPVENVVGNAPKLYSACRNALKRRHLNFINDHVAFGISKCPLTGELLWPQNTMVIYPKDNSLDSIIAGWLEDKDIDWLSLKVKSDPDNNNEFVFKEINIAYDFLNYHNTSAKMTAVSTNAKVVEG